ncbi:MAG: hypothetical protein K2I96_04990 [Lachnospiraceae bacterium]|nr:hypothetical protein [Lachnospiraceae bacterium]
MKKVTAKDLLNDQKKRFWHLRQKEEDNRTTENAKANFRRAPYMGLYRKQDQCGNDLGGRG